MTPHAAPEAAPAPEPKGSGRRILLVILTLALGAAGGWVATQIGLPLPWMIGAMLTTTAATLMGLRLFVHSWVRSPNVAIL